ncbi:hypothetical protein CE91St36_07590 [Christensenellaceae bacterium]|nr:hypothetical protein CE91St36_07590 [Christensenellaceae bacterium]BDF60610.1 hypothetical protein CE91St37_07600 [Christensenellaceae bacterium]
MLYRAMLKKESAKKNGKKAFTLIELIVVIAIIGVLVAILVPTMMGFVDDAKDATRLANARTVYSSATAAYASAVSKANGQAIAAGTLDTAVGDLLGDAFASATYDVNWAGTADAVTGVTSVTFSSDGKTVTYPGGTVTTP